MSERWPDACTDAVFEVNVIHAYFGDGYGRPTEACIKAIRLAAHMEGLLFDPVYSGKALAGLIDQINLGNLQSFERCDSDSHGWQRRVWAPTSTLSTNNAALAVSFLTRVHPAIGKEFGR